MKAITDYSLNTCDVGIPPAKRIKRKEATLCQFEILRRVWVDEDLRMGLKKEFRQAKESKRVFLETLRRNNRRQAADKNDADFKEWEITME